MDLNRQIRAARREVGQREHVYPRLVSSQRMTQKDADEEIAAMKAILSTLEGLLPKQAELFVERLGFEEDGL